MITLGVFWISAHYKRDSGDIYWGTVIVDIIMMISLTKIL
ncbi:TMhelix containing protein [Vibrio phage 1.170.O._10N.261.52.C3]|nr:TMhelix containing protein [Vibrio phage 1.170.O._10N.261.52.C3]